MQGVLMLGTTGEGVLLTSEERRCVAELAVAGAGALPVMVHRCAQTTAEAAIKAAPGLRGVPVLPDVRAPLRSLGPDAIEELRGVATVAEASSK
jgi:dihydrodipicolinate synthase/N-acetylneuraminate lyase